MTFAVVQLSRCAVPLDCISKHANRETGLSQGTLLDQYIADLLDVLPDIATRGKILEERMNGCSQDWLRDTG